jgi:dTDP-4-amino-4,6-dideoxygalactose transaminase
MRATNQVMFPYAFPWEESCEPQSPPPAIVGGKPQREDYLVFGSPLIGEEEIQELVETVRSGWIGTGPKTAKFEREFAAYQGAAHAVAVNSCTAALHLSLVAAGVGPGDEVIVPAMTFVATANSVIHAGGTPVLCDVDRETHNMRPEDVEARLTPRTRVILPVHFAGRAADLTALQDLARARGCTLINDAAHAIEAEHRGRKIASYGEMTAYSFYPTKNITTGEGGMVVTNDEALARRLRVMRLHGLSADAWKRFSDDGYRHYEAIAPGFKYNMTDMQAALGLHQLARIEKCSMRRREIWEEYRASFCGLPLRLPLPEVKGDRHALHLFTVLLELENLTADRDTIMHALHCEGIGTGVHYRGVHLHSYYRERFGYTPGMFPNASHISERTISLPLSAKLADADVDDVIRAVKKVLRYYRRPILSLFGAYGDI